MNNYLNIIWATISSMINEYDDIYKMYDEVSFKTISAFDGAKNEFSDIIPSSTSFD